MTNWENCRQAEMAGRGYADRWAVANDCHCARLAVRTSTTRKSDASMLLQCHHNFIKDRSDVIDILLRLACARFKEFCF